MPRLHHRAVAPGRAAAPRAIRRGAGALGLALATALSLAACGTTESAGDVTGGSGSLTVTDARGTDVRLDGPAERVIATEWNVAEHLVSLGVMPVGVADVDGYGAWVDAAPLDDDVTDIGVRGEPSIDTIAELDPDLILATTDLPETAVAQLEEYYPVVVVRSADATRPYEQMLDNIGLVAEATGTEKAEEDLLAELDSAIAGGRDALTGAGLDGTPLAFTDAYLEDGRVSIRPYADGSLLAAVNDELGLANPWALEGDPAYGLAQTDVEGLTTLPADAALAYIANDDSGPDPFTDALASNAVWTSLPLVQADRVHRLPDGIWMFGGPASMMQYVDALVGELTA